MAERSTTADPSRIMATLGPTLGSDAARAQVPGLEVVPPIEADQALHLGLGPGDCLIIVDGLFRQSRAIRHKEILALIDRDVRVIGASSMGALRAAELWEHGMRGVGTVFELLRSGTLEGDDEVAVTHLTAEYDFRQVTPALVDLRVTLRHAVREGCLSVTEAKSMVAGAAGLPFPERHPVSLAKGLVEQGDLPEPALTRWRTYLRLHQLQSIKQNDAKAALAVARRWGSDPTIGANTAPGHWAAPHHRIAARFPETSFLNAWRVSPSSRAAVQRLQLHRSGSSFLRALALESLLEERIVDAPPPDVRSPNEVEAIRTRLTTEIGEQLPNPRENSRHRCAQILARHRPDLCQAVRLGSSTLLAEERTWEPDLQSAGAVLRRWRADLRTPWLPRVAERLTDGGDLIDDIGFQLEAGGGTERQLRRHWSLRHDDPWPEALLERGFIDNVDLARAIRQTKLMTDSTAGEHSNA